MGFNQVLSASCFSSEPEALLTTERTSLLIVHPALQHFLDCLDFVHAALSAYDDRSPPQDTLTMPCQVRPCILMFESTTGRTESRRIMVDVEKADDWAQREGSAARYAHVSVETPSSGC